MTLKEFIRKVKIFMWYLITEPFRQFYSVWFHLLKALDKTISILYIILVVAIIALVVGNQLAASLLVTILLIALIMWEWQSGFFMYRYRQRIRKKVKTELNKTESDKL